MNDLDEQARQEFLAAFADVYKLDAFERRCRFAFGVLLGLAIVVALGIAYACGAQWGF